MNLQTIESQDFTLGKLFDDFYAVPNYQREYIWEDKQVEQLLQDIYTEHSFDSRSTDSEYFIGTIVVCPNKDGVFDLIDGQQRMTTIYLILCAIRDRMAEVGGSPIQALERQIASTDVDKEGEDVFRYRVDLQYEDSSGVLVHLAKGNDGELAFSKKTRSVTNILTAYRTSQTFLRREIGDDKKKLRQFYAYFTKNVKLIRVQTISIAHALKVFETINDRGVGLDSMDLLKNLIFMHSSMDDFDKLKDKWKNIVDSLYNANEKPLRFLRYLIFARYDVDRLREDEIYEWFVKNEKKCGYKQNPIGFVDGLLDATNYYVGFSRGNDLEGKPNRHLHNFGFLSGAARQHLILLLAGSHLSGDMFSWLAKELENLFFVYLITREPTREFERTFALWTKTLRAVKTENDLKQFFENTFWPAKKRLAPRFHLALNELEQYDLQNYRLKYILAKLSQYVDLAAWGEEGAQTDLGAYINRKIDIEHILPLTPKPAVREEFDSPAQYDVYKLRIGNLTLLEKSINSSISNDAYEKKKKGYEQSNILLTRALSKLPEVGKNTSVNRASEMLESFDEWTSKSIMRRQRMLAKLAYKVWEMPVPDDEDEFI